MSYTEQADLTLEQYQSKPLHQSPRGKDVARLVLEPFTNTQLLVFTRNADGPFSCRVRGYKRQFKMVTVLGVVMPDRTDLLGEPTLRILPASQYADLVDVEPLRDSIRNKLREIEYTLTHGATLYQIQLLDEQLKGVTL